MYCNCLHQQLFPNLLWKNFQSNGSSSAENIQICEKMLERNLCVEMLGHITRPARFVVPVRATIDVGSRAFSEEIPDQAAIIFKRATGKSLDAVESAGH